MASSLWQVDPADAAPGPAADPLGRGRGRRHRVPARRRAAVRVERPDPDAKPDPEKKVNALWALPADGGEARLLVAPEGGVCGIAVARDAHALVFGANVQRGARDFEGDTERTKARKDAGVEALLFEDYPIRHWDHYLGPRLRRLYAATVPEGEERIERAARPRRGRHRASRSTSPTPTSAPTARSSSPCGACSRASRRRRRPRALRRRDRRAPAADPRRCGVRPSR